MGDVLRERPLVWLHVDAAYAGAAAVCPELRKLVLPAGLVRVDSFNFNLHKWLLVPFDASAMWVLDRRPLEAALRFTPTYLNSAPFTQGLAVDFRNLQVPLGRRFKALKVWMTLRAYGMRTLRQHVRGSCELAMRFAAMVQEDPRFEVVLPPRLGLVCFRLVPRARPGHGADAATSDSLNRKLQQRLADGGFLFLVCTTLPSLRFSRKS